MELVSRIDWQHLRAGESDKPEVCRSAFAIEQVRRKANSRQFGKLSRILLLASAALVCLSEKNSNKSSSWTAAQDVTLELETSPSSSGPSEEESGHEQLLDEQHGAKYKMKSLDEFLAGLPTVKVGQRQSARIECELNEQPDTFGLVWLRLNRGTGRGTRDDTQLISFGQKLITPDKRFKVYSHSPVKWTLFIETVRADDNLAYFLCQTGQPARLGNQPGSGSQAASRFIGGARLSVFVPPQIVEKDTSASLVIANEFEPLTLHCKVVSEPRSQLTWKREDGTSIESMEQHRFHEKTQRQGQSVSVDSSELLFGSFSRGQAGAYLCIASNGIQPGVSQRVNVRAANCRASGAQKAQSEPCERPQEPTGAEIGAQLEPRERDQRKGWRSGHRTSGRQQRLQAQDKRRERNETGSSTGRGANRATGAGIESATIEPTNSADASLCADTKALIWTLLLHFGRNIITLAVHHNSIVIL